VSGPIHSTLTGTEAAIQLPVKPLYEAIGLRMVGNGHLVLNPKMLHMLPCASEENCTPLSEVTEVRTPNQAIRPEKRASAQHLVEVDENGMALPSV
jgi:hypothetical protein